MAAPMDRGGHDWVTAHCISAARNPCDAALLLRRGDRNCFMKAGLTEQNVAANWRSLP